MLTPKPNPLVSGSSKFASVINSLFPQSIDPSTMLNPMMLGESYAARNVLRLLQAAQKMGYPVAEKEIGLFTKGIPASIRLAQYQGPTLAGKAASGIASVVRPVGTIVDRSRGTMQLPDAEGIARAYHALLKMAAMESAVPRTGVVPRALEGMKMGMSTLASLPQSAIDQTTKTFAARPSIVLKMLKALAATATR